MRVLLVEDEVSLATALGKILEKNKILVDVVHDGIEGKLLSENDVYDVIVLDIMLPGMSGLDILKSIRDRGKNVPVLLLTAKDSTADKVKGLDMGADDYLVKPFVTEELLARIRTAMRHQQVTVDVPERTIFSVGDLTIDFDKRLVTLNNNPVHFTPIEYKILEILTQYPGKVVTYDQIIKDIWGPYTNENQTLRVNMANIRRKIEKNPAEPKYILTEVGVGYRFVDEI